MDFRFFEELTREQAEVFLENYRRVAAENLSELERLAASRDVKLDLSLESVRPAFEAVAEVASLVPSALDQPIPAWIGASEGMRPGAVEFSEETRFLILRLSYYLAESLMRATGMRLRWGIGAPDTAVQQQPVLKGFKGDVEMSPLLVTENLLRRLVNEPDPSAANDVDKAVSTWRSLAGPDPSGV